MAIKYLYRLYFISFVLCYKHLHITSTHILFNIITPNYFRKNRHAKL